jgi:2-hydroxycyclohexanecarboxyl-CoA dehydrogenase
LVHTAAIGSGYFGFPFTRIPVQAWTKVLEVNILGMTHVAHAVTPSMVANKSGSMIYLSSVAGQIGSPTDPPYSAAKAANLNFAICMARDLSQHNIRVNSVCPGMVKTNLNRSVWQAWYDQALPNERQDYETWAGEKIARVIPLGRWQTPEDVADAIVFLSSPRAAQITGQTINVDGGFVMRM